MTPTSSAGLLPLVDYHPRTDTFREEVLEGLQQPQKAIPPKFFYDAEGSRLFDQITELPEYYPTRTETGILETHIEAIVDHIGPHALLVEYGSGSSIKTRILLDHLRAPAGYVPIDISRKHLLASAERLAALYPELAIAPVCADYTTAFELPDLGAERTAVFFPGSTIGNFEPASAQRFLTRLAAIVGSGGGLLIGVDLAKDRATVEAAYNDAQGVTAAFNLNLLKRINRELDGSFDLDAFRHRAVYNEDEGRIEMHLVSPRDQRVGIDGEEIAFEAGEVIVTEYSYKYTRARFERLADRAGFDVEAVWTDDRAWFSVQYLVAR